MVRVPMVTQENCDSVQASACTQCSTSIGAQTMCMISGTNTSTDRVHVGDCCDVVPALPYKSDRGACQIFKKKL